MINHYIYYNVNWWFCSSFVHSLLSW